MSEFKILSMGPGDAIIKEGDSSKNIYFLQKGKLNVFVKRDNKNEKVGEVNPGELVGEMAFIENIPRTATVIAAQHSEVVEISSQLFSKEVNSLAPWMQAFIKSLIRRIIKKNK